MRKFLKPIVFIFAFAALVSAFALAGCGGSGNGNGNNGDEHTHVYSTEWEYDDTYHWHKATCEHKDKVEGKAGHELVDGKCAVCDYKKKEEPAPAVYHKVVFKQEGYSDIVKWVEDLAGLEDDEVPEPVKIKGYDIVWEEKDLSCITEDITVNAVKTPITYTITYHLNGGKNAQDNPVNYTIETEEIDLLPATKEGYLLSCWYSDENFETRLKKIPKGSCGDLDLYAKWVYGTEGFEYYFFNDAYSVTGYSGTAVDVVIPNEWDGYPVTAIRNRAFENCETIESITISEGLTSIGDNAFYGCSGLKSIIIADSVTECGSSAFRKCTGLESIILPEGLTEISYSMFEGCTSINSITLPEGLISIDYGAFRSCTGLTAIELPDNVTKIGSRAFDGCQSLTSVNIPVGVTSIESSLFMQCTSLTNVSIAEGVKTIESFAFEECTSLKSISLPESLTAIGNSAFYKCSGLKSAIIPEGITEISISAFDSCTSLESISLPESLTTIDSSAFSGCINLFSITVPKNVTEIKSGAFSRCFKLLEIHDLSSLNIQKPGEDEDKNKYGSIAYYAKVVTHYTNGNWINRTDDGYVFFEDTFYSYLLGYSGEETKLSLPLKSTQDRAYEIYKYAFYSGSFESITIPDSVYFIDSHAFENCSNLKTVYWNATDCTTAGVLSRIWTGCTALTTLVIGENVEKINRGTFGICENLKSVTFSGIVLSIDEDAFYECYGLESINFEGTVEEWGTIEKNPYWNNRTSDYIIYCSDGEIAKDGTVTKY